MRCSGTPRARSTRCIGFRRRSRRSARCSKTSTARWPSRTQTTGEMSDNAASASSFIVSVGDSAAEIDSRDQGSRSPWRKRRQRRQGRHHVRAETEIALRGAAAPGRAQGTRSKSQPLPCNLKIEIQTARGVIVGTGLRNLDRRHSDRRTGGRKAGAERNASMPRCRISAPAGSASGERIQGRRAGAVRAAGRRADGKDRRQALVDPGRKHRVRHPRDGSRPRR